MTKFLRGSAWIGIGLCAAIAAFPRPAAAQVCAPLDDGRVANVYHEGTLLYFEPVVEFREMVLTITGPCEDIVKRFGPKDQISFDIREIERVTDGHYNWTLQRVASIDERLQQELQEARGSGKEDGLWWNAFQAGKIPEGPYADSGAFTVERGLIIDPASGEEKRTIVAKGGSRASGLAGAAAAGVAGGDGSGGNGNTLATKDFVINDDLIVQGSTCVGFDCVNGEAFSFDTIRLKENNLRIKFEDTSGGSFPTRDWEIEANSSANGGQSHFRINDVDGARSPFTIVAGAPSHSLHVGSTGRVGLRTSTPVLDLHISTSNTPGMRLEQTNAGGFTAQTWDVAGNEANFFVRDVTGGSRLPLRIRPGAPTSSIDISAGGNVGMGTTSPTAQLHLRRTDGTTSLRVEEASGTEAAREVATFLNNGTVTYRFSDTQGTASAGDDFNWIAGLRTNNQFIITLVGTIASPLWTMDSSGNVTATSFNPTSSRELKEGFAAIEPKAVLDKVLRLPISEWSYRKDVSDARHLGPVAEDFRAAFGLGADDRHISVTDLGGVSLAAIQGLHQELESRDQALDRLEKENDDLTERLRELELLVSSLASADR